MATKILYFFGCLLLCGANPLHPSICDISNLQGIKSCEKSNFNVPYQLSLGHGHNLAPVIEPYSLGLHGPGQNIIETMPPISVGMDTASLNRLLGTSVVENMPLSVNSLAPAPMYETAIGVGTIPVYEAPIVSSYNMAPMYENPAIGRGNIAPIYEPVVSIGVPVYGFNNAPIYEPVGVYSNMIEAPIVSSIGYSIAGNVPPVYEAPIWPSYGVGYGIGNIAPVFESPMPGGGVGYGISNMAPIYEQPTIGYGNMGYGNMGYGNMGYGMGGLYPYAGFGKPTSNNML